VALVFIVFAFGFPFVVVDIGRKPLSTSQAGCEFLVADGLRRMHIEPD